MTSRVQFLPFALPDIGFVDLVQIREALESGWVTTGPKTRQFEAEFAASVGAKHALAVNSCTAAMHLALEASGVGAGDEVIIPTYTFAASAEVVRYFDAKPVLVDIRADDFNLDVSKMEAAITPRTCAVIPVHMGGLPAELDAVYALARRRHLAVVEDAAHAFPSTYKGQRIGEGPGSKGQTQTQPQTQLRHAVCFSFYATKTLTTGEGGMICTESEEVDERCRIMSLHGISRDAWKRYTAEGSWYYEIVAPGFKYNMSDIAAAMGIAQLHKAERMWRRRVEIAQRYSEVFGRCAELQTPADAAPGSQHAWHLYMLRLNLERLRIDRAQFMQELKERQIGASVHFIPLHIHPYYRETYGYRPEDFPVAYGEYFREVSLPIYSKMSDEDVQDVIDAVCAIVEAQRR